MKGRLLFAVTTLCASASAFAQDYSEYPPREPTAPPAAPAPAPMMRPAARPEPAVESDEPDSWKESARFFAGMRMGVGFPAGGKGMATTGGFELGVSAKSGVGFGLHLLGGTNPPAVPALGIPKTEYVIGAEMDIRWYFQSIDPLTLYPTLSLGFLAGPAVVTGDNAVLPIFNPGFGARVRLDPLYVGVEIGLAAFQIPYVTFTVGYEPPRENKHKPAVATRLTPCPAVSAAAVANP